MTRCALALFLTLPAVPAFAADPIAEVICADRAEMLHRLTVDYGAERQGGGLRDADAMIEVWAVPSTGDWTLVQTYANGRACILAMGENWDAPRPADDPA